MAMAATPVAGAGYVSGNKRVRVFDLVFSGNHVTGGEPFTPSTFGLRHVTEVQVHGGVAMASNAATALPIGVDYSASKFTFYEGSAAGTALSEKTGAEAYPTGCKCRVSVTGF